MSDLHKSDPTSPWGDDMEFVRDYARRNDGYSLVQPVVDFINQHLAPPRIIRTVAELEALDPDTLLSPREALPMTWQPRDLLRFKMQGGAPLPAVVIRDGAEVRAARKALEKETTND